MLSEATSPVVLYLSSFLLFNFVVQLLQNTYEEGRDMPNGNNNRGTQQPQQPQQPKEYPMHENADYSERSHPDGRTTETDAAPSPGHKK